MFCAAAISSVVAYWEPPLFKVCVTVTCPTLSSTSCDWCSLLFFFLKSYLTNVSVCVLYELLIFNTELESLLCCACVVLAVDGQNGRVIYSSNKYYIFQLCDYIYFNM